MEYDVELGRRIRNRRELLGMSQAELAEKVGYTSRSAISRIENGERSLNVSQLPPIARALSCSVDDLLDGVSPEKSEIAELFERLDPDLQEAVLRMLETMLAERKKD